MQTDPNLLIKKVFNHYRKQINFLEEYYSKEIGRKIKIELTDHETSYYDMRNKRIYISTNNLLAILVRVPKLFYSLFYTLILHEIGHAIYTDMMPMNDITNILEDNRTEALTTRWNRRVKFSLFRFVFQDISLDPMKLKKKTDLGLALLRTVDNSLYVQLFGNTFERKEIIDKILVLDKTYTSKNYKFSKSHDKMYELEDISREVSMLLDKLIESWNSEQPEPPEPQKGKGETSDKEQEPQDSEQSEEEETDGETKPEDSEEENGEEESDSKGNGEDSDEDEQEEDNDTGSESGDNEEEQEDNENSSESNSEETKEEEQSSDNGEDSDDSESIPKGITEEELQELKDELSKEFQKGKEMEQDLDNGTGSLYNDSPNKDEYEMFKISAFTTVRRSGIKGSRDVTRYSGSANQLSLKKYSRRNHVPNEKMFDKTLDHLGRGGKNASVVFYLDISASMDGNKLYHSINYLKSFYDQMHKHLNIRFMAFGENTYELTRQELEYEYLEPITEDSTRPKPIKLKRNEEIIFVTDGIFHTQLPDHYMKKAHFVLVDIGEGTYIKYFSGMKHTYRVSTKDIKKGLESATKHIREMLRSAK